MHKVTSIKSGQAAHYLHLGRLCRLVRQFLFKVRDVEPNNAFERTVQALALARGRRGGQFASAARSRAHRAAAQRER